MLGERIMALIRDYNPWWEGKETAVPEYKRHIFSKVQEYMKTRQIIAVTGLRRVGKTVLMRQIMKTVKASPENIFYFLFDDLIAQNPEVLEDVLNHYLKTIAKEGKKYIFLDEIQKVPHWQEILKRFYDTKEDIKFVISGSASLQIKKSKESLAGRLFDFCMPPLVFREFLELNGIKAEKPELNFGSLKEVYGKNLHKKAEFGQMLREYAFRGAFPEMATEKDGEIIKSYIKNSVIEKIIFEDIPAVFDIKRKDILFSILEYCSRGTSGLLDITNLAKTVGANYETAKSYLFYLENSFILDIVYNYSKSIAKQLRKNKKVHIAHPSIAITIMRYSKDMLEIEELAGKYMETIAFQHSKLLSERIFFWRTPQKEEVDIILDTKNTIPIEVKYRAGGLDTGGLIKFMKEHNLKRGILITKDLMQEKEIEGKTVLFVPAWLFLLAV